MLHAQHPCLQGTRQYDCFEGGEDPHQEAGVGMFLERHIVPGLQLGHNLATEGVLRLLADHFLRRDW